MPIQRILVVEDSPTERLYFTHILSRQGYHVITAEDGADALLKAKSERPDLILMDIIMPGMNGFQATRMITRDEATRHIPVIMCTGKDKESDKVWALRQGATDYLTKPVLPQVLLDVIRGLA